MKRTTLGMMIFILVFLVSCQSKSPFDYQLPEYNPSFKTAITINADSINEFVDNYLDEVEESFPYCSSESFSTEAEELTREELDQYQSGMCEYRPWKENAIRYQYQQLLNFLEMGNNDYITNQSNHIGSSEYFLIESNDLNLRITYISSSSIFMQYTFGEIDGQKMMEFLYADINTTSNTFYAFSHSIYYENHYYLNDNYRGDSRDYYYEDLQEAHMTYYRIRMPGNVYSYYSLTYAYREDDHIQEVVLGNSSNDTSDDREILLMSLTTTILNDELDIMYQYFHYAPLRSSTFYANILEIESLQKIRKSTVNEGFYDVVLDNDDVISDIEVHVTQFYSFPYVFTNGPLTIMDRDLVPGYLTVPEELSTTMINYIYDFEKGYVEMLLKYGISEDSESFDDFSAKADYIMSYVEEYKEDHF
ncbi:MAG: hypothetical protein KKE16_02630 [Firmicutes bacterium]|nr:hypothetical protein [Bacillota bacterium]